MNLGDHPCFNDLDTLVFNEVIKLLETHIEGEIATHLRTNICNAIYSTLEEFELDLPNVTAPPITSEFITATWNGCGLVAAEDSLGAKQVLARLDKLEADLKEHVHKHIYNYGDTKLAD